MQTAMEQHRSWSTFIHSLPSTHFQMLCGRLLAMSSLAIGALALVILTANAMLATSWSMRLWCIIIVTTALGGLPMGILGMTLAQWVSARAASNVFILGNTVLLFAAFGFSSTNDGWLLHWFNPSYVWLQGTLLPILNQPFWAVWIYLASLTVVLYGLYWASSRVRLR